MSGKENAASSGGTIPAVSTTQLQQEPTSPLSQQDTPPLYSHDEMSLVTESLNQIEAILKAESKRRLEANRLTEEYILEYLEKLEQSLNSRVLGQFTAMERRIQNVDISISKIENQFEIQDTEVTRMIETRTKEADLQLKDTDLLLRNVKGAFEMQQETIDKREEKLVREIQLLLLNDKTQWSQVKAQVLHRLSELKSMGEVADFAEPLNEIAARLQLEQSERKRDDQEIIDLLNDVCFKMYQKIQGETQTV